MVSLGYKAYGDRMSPNTKTATCKVLHSKKKGPCCLAGSQSSDCNGTTHPNDSKDDQLMLPTHCLLSPHPPQTPSQKLRLHPKPPRLLICPPLPLSPSPLPTLITLFCLYSLGHKETEKLWDWEIKERRAMADFSPL